MAEQIRTLIVEDNPADAELVLRELRRAGFDPQWHRVETEADYLSHLHPDLDLILSDFEMPEFNGLRALELLKKRGYDIPFIIVSGTIGEETAVQAIKQGATDYLLKDRVARLGPAVNRALQETKRRTEREEVEGQLLWKTAFFEAQVNSALDGILIVDRDGKKVLQNQRMIDLWKLPKQFTGDSDDKEQLEWVTNQVRNPGKFADQVAHLYAHPDEMSHDEIELIDNRFFDRYSAPVRDKNGKHYGRIWAFRDITARKQSEESLTLFRSLIDRSNDAIEVIDAETGRFLDVNDTACRRLGYSREEMLSMHMPDIVDLGGSPLSITATVENVRKTGSRIVESRHRRKDGSTFPVEINAQLIHLKRDYLLAVVRDITERKLAEEALRSSETNMAAAQRIAHIGSWELGLSDLTDINANPLHWSDELIRIAGYEPGEVVVSNELFFQLVPKQEHGRLQEAIGVAIATRGPFSITHRLIRPNGEERIVHELAQVIIDEKTDKPLKLLGTTQDITEQKLADSQIAEQAALLDKAQDAIVTADLESKILFWNKGAERMYGWSKEEALGKKITELIAADPRQIKDIVPELLKKNEFSNEVVHLTKDGRQLTIEARRTLIRDDDGVPKSLFAIYTDITERKKIEAQFMRAQRMESIGTLAGGIAHDLNNILAPIMMSIDILKLSSTDPETISILKTIDTSAKRGADIVRQVLSFARGIEGERVEVQAKHLLKELENIIKDTFPKNIGLRFSVPTDIWTIMGDPTQIHQILLNLCVNARDAMPCGGTLTVSVNNKVIDEQYAAMNKEAKAGRYIIIRVTDSGTGIPDTIREKIFDPFFTTKEVNKGTGLGLSTVMAIVKSHQGVIEVSSEIGKGTTFKVCLPAMELSLERQKALPEEICLPRGRGETVLVVDDEASILAITSQTLKAFGYRVLTAMDGADAVAVYAQHTHEIAIVLTDMNMPVMDGPAMIRALTRLNPNLKIIAASGLNAIGGMTNTAEMQVKHFLTKPYTAATLLETLRKVLDET